MNDTQKNIVEYVKTHNLESLSDFMKKNKSFDLCFTDEEGKTLLHHVVATVSEKGGPMLQILLKDFNLDPNCVDTHFDTPIDIANNVHNSACRSILNKYIKERQLIEKSYLI